MSRYDRTGAATPTLRFIRETDEPTDAFGGHTRVAEAMAEALCSNPELRVVGLFGRWGSGKSRVVRLLQDRMEASGALFFVYDAWLHQSDAPRRAFLEALVDFLARKAVINRKTVQRDLDLLLGRLEVTTNKVAPQISIGSSVLLGLLLLIPVAAPFLRPEWMRADNALGFNFRFGVDEVGAVFVFALLAAAAPILLVAAVTLLRCLALLLRMPDPMGGISALLANKIQETRTEEKHKEPEPTALEFQTFMARLIGGLSHAGSRNAEGTKAKKEPTAKRPGCSAVPATEPRRLVLVFDNLDRLPGDEFEKLWSTLRTLFHGEAMKQSPENITVILPVDEAALQKLRENDQERAIGFSEKTFDLTFSVTVPIESAWQEFLGERLQQVFGAVAETRWAEIAARILEYLPMSRRTPRMINAYVNELGSLWLQWRRDPVSFAAMAYFAANRAEIEKNPWGHLQIERIWMAELDSNWVSAVAAIAFGVAPDRAAEILLGAKLRDVIGEGDEVAFDALRDEAGLTRAIRQLFDTFRSGPVSLPFSHCTVLLARVAEDDLHIDAAWNTLRDVFAGAEWQPLAEVDLVALELLLSRSAVCRRAALAGAVRDKLQRLSENVYVQSAPLVLQAACIVARYSPTTGLAVDLTSMPAGVLALAMAAAEPAELTQFRFEGADEQLGLQLAMKVEEGLSAAGAVTTLQKLGEWQPKTDKDQLVRGVIQRISASSAEGARHLVSTLPLLSIRLPEVRPEIDAYTGSTVFARRLQDALVRGDLMIAAQLIALAIICGREPAEPTDGGWKEVIRSTPDLVAEINSSLASAAPDVGVEALMTSYSASSPFVAVARAVARARFAESAETVRPEDVAAQVRGYLDFLPPSHAPEFWAQFDESKTFWRHLVRHSSNKDIGRMARAILQETLFGPVAKRFAARALARTFGALANEHWQQAVIAGEPPFAELVQIGGYAPEIKLEGELEEALQALVPFICQSDDPQPATRWFALSRRLRTAARRRTYQLLRDHMVMVGTPRADILLAIGGKSLIREGHFSDIADGALVRVVIDMIERSGGVLQALEASQWLEDLLESASPEARFQLMQAAQRRLSEVSSASPLHGQLHHVIQLTGGPRATL